MDLTQLKKEIPFKWRVQSFSKYKPEATCVAYLDSRQVQDLLDKVAGPENWQDKYEEHKGNLFCSIGIKTESGWVWKTDCGTESNVDKEKGEASDAFKRAAVKWGIGRFLYSKAMVRLPANTKKADGIWPYVIGTNNKRVWDLTKHINSGLGGKKPTQDLKGAMTPDQIKAFYSGWNGKIYKGNVVYWNDEPYKLSDAQAAWLKKQGKFKEE